MNDVLWKEVENYKGRMKMNNEKKFEPVAYAVTCNGEYSQNLFVSRVSAEALKHDLDHKFPDEFREVVALTPLHSVNQ